MIESFKRDLKAFKKTVEEYDDQRGSTDNVGTDVYKISYINEKGCEVLKTFNRTGYSKKAKLLLQELRNAIDEIGQSITEQEKRQVLMELLQKLC
jgi:tRNA U34 5-carboxymethylaminomethyl modifying GTPase MnmE/TrmE